MAAYVYLLSNKTKTVIYTGVTSDLIRRIYEHKNGLIGGFTSRYKVKNLVYYEVFDDIINAIEREKQIKSWKRKKKEQLIYSLNPDWHDLYDEL